MGRATFHLISSPQILTFLAKKNKEVIPVSVGRQKKKETIPLLCQIF